MLHELSLSSITVDHENLKLWCHWVLIGFLNKVSERLHERLAGRTVLSREKHCHMRHLGSNHCIIDANLFISVELLLTSIFVDSIGVCLFVFILLGSCGFLFLFWLEVLNLALD